MQGCGNWLKRRWTKSFVSSTRWCRTRHSTRSYTRRVSILGYCPAKKRECSLGSRLTTCAEHSPVRQCIYILPVLLPVYWLSVTIISVVSVVILVELVESIYTAQQQQQRDRNCISRRIVIVTIKHLLWLIDTHSIITTVFHSRCAIQLCCKLHGSLSVFFLISTDKKQGCIAFNTVTLIYPS